MRRFFQKSLNNKLEFNCVAYPKVSICYHAMHGLSKYSLYALAYNDTRSKFFTSVKMKSAMTVLLTMLFDRSFRGCYVMLILNSLNYFIKRMHGRRLKLDFHFSRKLILPVPSSVMVRTLKKRISFFGLPENVIPFVHTLVRLRPFNVYTGYGVRIPYSGTKKKPGKVRVR